MDDGATYAIAQKMRSEVFGWGAAAQSLGRVQSGLFASSAAASAINDVLVDLRAKITAYSDASQSAGSIALLRQDIESLIKQVTQQASLADFDGLNFVNGSGTPGTVFRMPSTSYRLTTSPLTPQSFNTIMSAGAANSDVSASMSTTYNFDLPYSPLTPDSFAAFAPAAVAKGTSVVPNATVLTSPQNLSFKPNVYGEHPFGDQPTRVGFEFDMLTDADVVEIWQNGVRVAATGQGQALGGVAVGPGIAVTGRQMVSFDYLPAKGTDVEVRISSSTAGSSLIYYGSDRGTVGSPAPAPNSTMSRLVSSTPQITPLPATPLNIETSGVPPANGNPSAPYVVNGGSNAGRVDLLFDASITPDVVEIWQGGVRVAASGQSYIGGGGGVSAGVPTAGPQVISFDYKPASGQALEFRFNENNAHPGAAWVVGGLVLQATTAPLPTLPSTSTTSQSLQVSVADDAEFIGPPPPLTPETYATVSTSKVYLIDGGTNPGRIDIAFDAYDDADVMEIRQNGNLVASTGPVTGMTPVSFNYDPNNGQSLEFSFNPGNDAPGAWTVGAIAFNPIGSPPVSPIVSGGPSTGTISGTIYTKITPVRSADGSTLEVATRNLTATGLGLVALDWTDPSAMMTAVNKAIGIATEASAHLGTQEKLIEALLTQNGKLRDSLNSGIGNLVDADLGKESAKLQAQQIRQQLAAQTLSIANSEPEWMLSLFR